MLQLSGKVAVVTGAASGIGRALAEACAAEGMRVVLADVDEARMREVEAVISERRAEVLAVRCDTARQASVVALAEAAMGRFGAVHLLCNNAGTVGRGDPWTGPFSAWEFSVGVNLYGVVHGVRAFLPIMREQGEGHIVNTASMAGLLAMPGYAAYTATKHAVVGVSESLRAELRAAGEPIGVSVVCPGFVNTNLLEERWDPSLGAVPPDSTAPAALAMGEALRQGVAAGIPPGEVAAQVLDAVRAGRFWVLTNPELSPVVTDRFRRAVDGDDPM